MLLASLPRLFVRHALGLAVVLTGFTATLRAQTPAAADGFDPDVDGNVFALVTQPDGKVIVAGQFANVRGVPRNNLARLNADGSLDESFNPNPNAPVRALLLAADNRIIIGGDFTSLQPNAAGAAVARSRLARLNVDGTVDSAFAINIGGLLRPQVFALAQQPDGSLVVGGSFDNVQPGLLTVIFNRRNIFRLTAAGAVDATFDPNPNGMVLALAPHIDGKIVVGGGFTTFQENGKTSATTRNRIARLNRDGTVDSEFNPNADNGVTTLAVQRDGKILLGGFFNTLQPINEESPANRPHLARLNVNGSIDSEFYPRAEGKVSAIALQPDGSVIIGGTFSAAWGRGTDEVARNNIARFNPDGSLDVGFNLSLNGEVDAFTFQSDGKIVVGGYFTRAQPVGAPIGLVRNHLARLNTDGSLDTSFQLSPGGRILASITQADGKIVVGGSFTSAGGATHDYLARFNADGSIDATYNPDLDGRVFTMAYEASSNKVIIGGAFTTITGETRNHIARLNPNGTIDSEFNPNIDGQVGIIVLQSDGRMLVGGSFNNVQPLGATTPSVRPNLLRLNSSGTLDTAFHPNPNSSVSAITVQGDGKILLGGLFSTFTADVDLTPVTTTTNGTTTTTIPTGTTLSRGFLARVNSDGTLDTPFTPTINGPVSSIVVQSDNKIIIGGAFTAVTGTDLTFATVKNPDGTTTTTAPVRNHLARLEADGKLDKTYDPNANDNVFTMALQSDGKLLIGGAFTLLQPNGRSDWFLRKYVARLNADGTLDEGFNLDVSEFPGSRVDSIRVQSDGRIVLGGAFTSLQPTGTPARITRPGFARLNSNLTVDTTFDPGTGGSTGAIVNGIALQADGKIVAVGNFGDLGGAKSNNVARFLPEGTPDPQFGNSLSADGPVNAVVVRPNVAPVASQLNGFAWLTASGTLRPGFASGANARLSGEINAIAVQSDGSVLFGGAFSNLSNATSPNLARFSATGVLDTSFNPTPNGAVTGIAVQPDGRIIIVGAFTAVGDQVRNHIARLNTNGSPDVTFDPNVNAKIDAVLLQANGQIVIGGTFTSLTPNFATTATTRNYLARLNADGSVDTSYDPAPNADVRTLALQSDGKIVAGGVFSTLQPNGGTTAFTRFNIARINTDGTVDQNFDPNVNAAVNAIAALPNGQFIVGGAFTTLQPNGAAAPIARNNLARINSDGAIDLSFNPNVNGAVTTVAVQPDGSILIGGAFTTVQPPGLTNAVTRNRLARLNSDGSLDLVFNPDVNGTVSAILPRPDGTVMIGGNFTQLELNGSIVLGGNFATIGGVPARNLAMLNDNGAVNATFQPRPDGVVNALLVQPDGKIVVGGAFTNIAGVARNRLARFNTDGTLDATFNPNANATVNALALGADGKIIVGGVFNSIGGQARLSLARLNADGSLDASLSATGLNSVLAIVVQPDGRIVATVLGVTAPGTLVRFNTEGSIDPTFASRPLTSAPGRALALQADGRVILGGAATGQLVRLNANGATDPTFTPAPNGAVTAVALQPDGRLIAGGGFTQIGGQQRVGIARLAPTGPATQILGVAANRSSVVWNRTGTIGEISAALFEISTDRFAWTPLGAGTRIAGTSNWQLTGLNLPANGLFYIRARGIAPTAGGSSGVYESVREFTFANPLGLPATPAIAAITVGGAPILDNGFVARSTISVASNGESVEIFVGSPAQTAAADALPPRLANLSTRGRVATTDPLILGFAIAGNQPRRVLIRAVGPGLTGFGVTGALGATRLQVYDASGALLTSNEGWGNAAELAQTATATGAFPLAAGSADSAAVLTLAPGNYTAQVVDTRGNGGVALAEIYDAGTGTGSRLINVSSRAASGTGANALISGFVIAGNASERVLLRGVGPGLAKFGANNVVADPSVALFDAQGVALGGNDNWVSSVSQVSTATTNAGAFPLDAGSKDAAVLATLPAGAYTIQVSAPTSGSALLEIYEVR